MANLSMLHDIKSDSATLSGGSWEATLPLVNFQNKRLKKTARSTDATTASTQFVIDLGGSGILYKVLALLSHNLSTLATYRVRCSDDVTFATSEYDSGWVDAYAYSIPTTEIEWEGDSWFFGKPAEADLAGYSLNTIGLMDYLIDSRYIKVEIDDTTNPDGYIELGRCFLSPITELLINMEYGATIKWNDSSIVSESVSGTEFFFNKKKKRTFSCASSFMEDAEALATIFEMQKSSGVTGEVFIMPDRDDTVNSFRTSFLSRMTELGGINKYIHEHNKTTYQFKEII